MNHKPLTLLVALAAGSVHAAASSFADSVPEKAEGVPLAYVGKTTTAATALTAATTSPLHTAKPDACHHLALAVCAAAAAARMTEAAERLVGQARAAGCSWSRIARATGYRHDTSVRSVYDPVSRARRRRQSRAWRKRRDAPS